jgi:transcription initiation factor TFIIH subunit 1
VYVSLGELLRHFWNCFPATSPALQEKLRKTHETLKKFEQVKVQQLKDRMLRDHLNYGPLLAHLMVMLKAADNKFQSWSEISQKLK